MDFSLREDQRAIRGMARDFAAKELAPRSARWDEDKTFPLDALRAAAELGLAGIYVSGEVRDLRVRQVLEGVDEIMRVIIAREVYKP